MAVPRVVSEWLGCRDMMEGDRVRFRVEAVNYHETRKVPHPEHTLPLRGLCPHTATSG